MQFAGITVSVEIAAWMAPLASLALSSLVFKIPSNDRSSISPERRILQKETLSRLDICPRAMRFVRPELKSCTWLSVSTYNRRNLKFISLSSIAGRN